MSILLHEPDFLKVNHFKAKSANDILPSNIINDFITIMNVNVDISTMRSTLLELFGTVLEGSTLQFEIYISIVIIFYVYYII
jgi:hypothetical protein